MTVLTVHFLSFVCKDFVIDFAQVSATRSSVRAELLE